jgi:gliding motility-associated-like protein
MIKRYLQLSLSGLLVFAGISFSCFQVNGQNFLETFGTGANGGLPAGQTTYNLVGTLDHCPPGPPNDGEYLVTANIPYNHANCNQSYPPGTVFHEGWHQNLRDKTGNPMGRFLLVNAADFPGEFYTRTVTGLVPGNTYEFSAWVANVLKGGQCGVYSQTEQPVVLIFEIYNGNELVAALNTDTIPSFNSLGVSIPPNAPQSAYDNLWQELGLTFTAPSSTLQLRLINDGNGGCGNDLAIDDISFTTCELENEVSAGEDVELCETTVYGLSATGSSNGSWQVISGGAIITNPSNPNSLVTHLSSSNPNVFVWSTLICNETITDTITITIAQPPSIEIVASEQEICPGESINFSLSGNFTEADEVTWTFANASVENAQGLEVENISWSDPGTYTVSASLISSVCGSTQAETTITVNENLNINLSVEPNEGCSPLTVSFNNLSETFGADFTTSWFVNDEPLGSTQNITQTFDTPGSYSLKMITETISGCLAIDSVIIENAFTVHPIPIAELTILPGTEVELADANFEISGADLNANCTFQFNGETYNDCSFNAVLEEAGEFELFYFVTNEFGCENEFTTVITVNAELFIPNIITPNNDGVNDAWVLGGDLNKIKSVNILNRWGKVVYASSGYSNSNPFKGEFNGTLLPDGTYFFVIEFEDISPEKGTLTLLR